MHVVIIGINHGLQLSGIRGTQNPETENKLKTCYKRRLREIITSRGSRFVGEEMDSATVIGEVENDPFDPKNLGINLGLDQAKERVEIIGKQVAEEMGLSYAEIDMPLGERKKRGIPRDYSGKDSCYSSEQKARWNEEREMYMFEQTLRNAGPAQEILLICGRDHMKGLASLFGGKENTDSYNLTEEPWFVDIWDC